MSLKRVLREYVQCKQIMQLHSLIVRDLEIILNEQQGWKQNTKPKKIKKHFAKEKSKDYLEWHNWINSKKNISCSISSDKVRDQIQKILQEANHRNNHTKSIGSNDAMLWQYLKLNNGTRTIQTPLDLEHNLNVFIEKKEIESRFPWTKCPKRTECMYTRIYSIRTANPHRYVHIDDKTFCNTILICCTKDNDFNVMFEYESGGIYSFDGANYNFDQSLEYVFKKI